jgi:hypothetical protein
MTPTASHFFRGLLVALAWRDAIQYAGIEHAAPSDQRRATLTVRVVGMSLDVDAQTSIESH